MKKFGKTPAVLLFLTVVTVSYSLIINKIANTSPVLPDVTQVETTCAAVYTLKEYAGKVAIFCSDVQQPLEIFDTPVSALPKDDRERIKKGITVSDESQLQKLIEDYTS